MREEPIDFSCTVDGGLHIRVELPDERIGRECKSDPVRGECTSVLVSCETPNGGKCPSGGDVAFSIHSGRRGNITMRMPRLSRVR